MSDKDLLARLKAKAAEQSTPSPSTESVEGGSGLLDRLKAKAGLETAQPGPQVEEQPAIAEPQQPEATWDLQTMLKPTIETPQPKVTGVTLASASPQPKPKVVSTQKATKAPFRDSDIKIKSKTPQELELERALAMSSLSSDFDRNVNSLPPQFQENALNIPYTDPNNPISKITDPHGDPAYTGAYVQSRINTLLSDINKANAEGDLQTRDQYQEALKGLRKAGETMIDLQLFSKEYSGKQYMPEAAVTAMAAAEEQRKAARAELRRKLAEIDKWEHPNSVQAEKARKRIEVVDMAEVEKKYEEDVRRIKSQTKYNPVLLGAEREMLLGNKDAKRDYEALLAGKQIDPAKNYAYQDIGRRVIQYGIDNTQNENAKKEAAKHADKEGKQLITDNLPLLTDRARQVIGNRKYKDENPYYSALIPSMFLPDISEEDIKRYAEEEGFGEEITNELIKNPGEVPKSKSIWQSYAKGRLNFGAPSIYSTLVRGAGYLYDVPQEKMDAFFHPGWQDEKGLQAVIAGNAPTEQNSFRNIRGAAALMAETVGMMRSFGPIASGLGARISAATGLEEAAAEKLANFGIMGFEGYNNAYNESKEIVGDKPEDGGLRQAYSLLSGALSGAIFSISPPSKMVRAATGDMMKTGEQLVNEMKKVGVKGIISGEITPAYAKYAREILKAQGVIVTQADANLLAQNTLKNLFSKDGHKTPLTEGLGEETLRTYISFLIPTIFGGAGAAKSESPLNRAAAFEVASEPQKYKDFAKSQLDAGKYTESEYRNAIRGIDMLNVSLRNTPVLNNFDQDLTPNEVKEYMFNLTQDAALREKVAKIKKEAEVFKREPDKAQLSPIEQKISDLEKRRSEILNEKKVEAAPPVEEKKPEEKLVDSKEKDITLQSDIDSQESSQQKPQQNERIIESDQGRQSDTGKSESAGGGSEAEVRQTGNDQGRQQHQADRPLVEPEKPEEKTPEQGAPTRPAQRVRGQRRKPVEEEAPAAEGNVAPQEPVKAFGQPVAAGVVEVTHLTKREGFAHTKGAFKDASGKIYKSTETKDGNTQEHEMLNELQDLENVVRVGKDKVQTSNGEAFEIEELTPLKPGDKISMEEAREAMATMQEMDKRGISTMELEFGRDKKGKLKIFDLSLASRRKDATTDQSRSTYENNVRRLYDHLSEEDVNTIRSERQRGIEDAELEMLHPELEMAYDDSGTDHDKARRVEAAWSGVEDPSEITDKDLYGAGYRFSNGELLNPELLESRRDELKESIRKQRKQKQDASARSEEQQQEGPAEGGEPKPEGTEQARGEAKTPEAEGGDSVQQSEEEKIKQVFRRPYDSEENTETVLGTSTRSERRRLGVSQKGPSGVNIADVTIGNERVSDILDSENLSDKERDRLEDTIERAVGYWEFDEEDAKRWRDRNLNPEDLEDVFLAIDEVELAKESSYFDRVRRNREQLLWELGLYEREDVAASANERAAAKKLIEKIKADFDVRAVDVHKLLGIKERTLSDVVKEYYRDKEAGRETELTREVEDIIGSAPAKSRFGKKGTTPESAEVKPVETAVEPAKEDIAQEPTRAVTMTPEEQNAAKNRRKEGKYTVDGIEYVRNDVQEGPVGTEGTMQFSDKEDADFEYMLIEADKLQPSHIDGRRNPNFFIPEAQPKERSDAASINASDRIGFNPDIDKVGASPNAYSGAPVVNERGEIIQGNNRGEGLKKHYRSGGKSYKEQLAAKAAQFGLTPEQVEAMDKPVLVRRIKGSDEKAIKLGNYQAASIETGGKRRLDPVSTARRMSEAEKAQVVAAMLEVSTSKSTLSQDISAAYSRIFKILQPHLNPAEIESMLQRNGDPTSEGKADIEALVTQFLFEGGHVELPKYFNALSHTAQRSIIKALPEIFGVSKENSLMSEVQNAIAAARAFETSGLNWKQWLQTGDMFEGNVTPQDLYSPLELKLAQMLIKPENQSNLGTKFKKYASLVNGIKPDPFDFFRTEEVPPISKEQAIKETFEIENYEPEPATPTGSGEDIPAEVPPGPSEVESPTDREAPEAEGEPAEPEPDQFAESEKRLAEIAEEEKVLRLELQKQQAAYKQYNDALLKAEKDKDIEAWNKQNENLKKKEDRIAAINEKLLALAKESRDIELDMRAADYTRRADALRSWAKKLSKGSEGMLGVFPVINTHLVKPFIDAVADIYQRIGNLDIAISKAIDKFVFDGMQESLTKADIRKIRPALEWMEKPVQSQPKLSKINEDIAKEYVEDIIDREVDFTLDDAIQEIAEMDISDTLKVKMIDYIKWEVKDRDVHNSETLREVKHEGDFLDKYELTKSDKITKYLTADTQEDVFEQEVQYDSASKEVFELEDAVQDAANMMGLAKHHYGTEDVVLFGEDLLGKIAAMSEGANNRQTVKKILALSGLHNELHGERIRIEEKLRTADKSEVQDLRARLRKVNQIIAKSEVQHRNLVSSASEQLNAAKTLRLLRNEFMPELFAERILNDAERREKRAVQDALEKTEISDRVAEKGSFRSTKEAKEEIAAAEEAMKEAQGDLFKEPAEGKKSKSVISRIRDKVSGKKERRDGRKEIIKKEDAEKKAAKYLRGGTIEELIEKAKEQTKKPC